MPKHKVKFYTENYRDRKIEANNMFTKKYIEQEELIKSIMEENPNASVFEILDLLKAKTINEWVREGNKIKKIPSDQRSPKRYIERLKNLKDGDSVLPGTHKAVKQNLDNQKEMVEKDHYAGGAYAWLNQRGTVHKLAYAANKHHPDHPITKEINKMVEEHNKEMNNKKITILGQKATWS